MSLPERLQGVVDEFRNAPDTLKLPLLLEYANALPAPPAAMTDDPDRFERVEECQTPLFLTTDVHDDHVDLAFDAPEEAPTTRGFASILAHGLNGASVEEVLSVPPDMPQELGLTAHVSPLRMRGMEAMIMRIQRRVRAASGQQGAGARA